MTKRNICLLVYIILTFTFMPVLQVSARENVDLNYDIETDTYGNGEYAITYYKVDMVVNEDNTYDITEYIKVHFNVAKHGIFREIPIKNTLVRLDGSKSRNIAKVSNIKVNNHYTTSRGLDNYEIKIGNPNKTITGYEDYKISYTYDIGNDKSKGFDELYFNIIGTEWDTSISNIEFSITMPKKFDKSKLGFSSGPHGATDSNSITYSVDNKTINGKYLGVLQAKDALTVRLELPEGYFVRSSDVGIILMKTLPILCFIISLLIWLKYGKDEKTIETVEFYPPSGYNSAEIGFLYKGKLFNKDLVSLLIYLANKAYIEIVETELKTLFSKSESFSIVKKKDYDGDDYHEKLFIHGLFKNNKDEVNLIDLQNDFNTTSNMIKKSINSPENKEKIFYKNSLKLRIPILLLAITSFLAITAPPIYSYGDIFNFPIITIFTGLGFGAILFSIIISTNKELRIFFIIWGMIFGGIPWLLIMLPLLLQQIEFLLAYIIGILSIIGIVILIKHMPKRTPFGLEMLGKIKGFKRFLEVAEKSKLEALVMENPTYFYDILPYTYVLDVSDTWIKKFESITLVEPSWYHSRNAFSMHTFNKAMNNTMKSATKVMTSNTSGGGSSGGGSSGAGSGGGGGGSW